jgi:Ni2+-binding GTPase involved in maturation of urease and hydrogenase
MRFVTVSGPPSSGKTAVIIKTLEHLQKAGQKVGVVKFDCLFTDDDELYRKNGIAVRKGLAGALCPDHYFVSNVEECVQWGLQEGLDVLVSESAGLCNRCSPHIREVLAICVIDNLSGTGTPKKIGPMLKAADVVVVTKGDIVSQAEREVFASRVNMVNTKARLLHVNGITGQGSFELSTLWTGAEETVTVEGKKLRFSMPAALCSYCLGETRIGSDYQMGNVRKMDLDLPTGFKTDGGPQELGPMDTGGES